MLPTEQTQELCISEPLKPLNPPAKPKGKAGTKAGSKKRLSDAEKARRTAVIEPYQATFGQRSIAAISPERRREIASQGGKAWQNKIKAMTQAVCNSDSVEAVRARRIEIEGKRDAMLDNLHSMTAAGQTMDKDELAMTKAVLSEFRAEIRLLLDREDRARAFQGNNPNHGQRSPVSTPAPPPPAITPETPIQPLPSPSNPPASLSLSQY